MSVLADFSNASIEFNTVTGYASDGLNDVPVTSTVAVRALLKEQRTSIRSNPGLDTPGSEYKGYLVEDAEGIKFPHKARVIFDNGHSEERTVLLSVPSPYYDQVSLMGIPIIVR